MNNPTTTTTSAAPATNIETLLVRAGELEAAWYTGSRMWHGASGEPVTGEQAAAHLEAAAGLLDREGWEPGAFGLQEALAGPLDVAGVSIKVLELVICAHTGAGAAAPQLWDRVQNRTADEVRTLLTTGAAYARRYGPTAAPSGAVATPGTAKETWVPLATERD
ncbi:hypothetical protein [Streptomyces ipomoeae]|uniref:hypothetical protein n=1 Tax=Streptomyces ipomoeae TaxID=103232 RepID=UPI0015F07C03|nr:hypothetical protein [Streptomyces ipomoeae]